MTLVGAFRIRRLVYARTGEAAVDELNGVLESTPVKKIELLKPKDDAAEIKVHYAPAKEFPDLAKKYDFKFEKGQHTYAWVWWNGKSELAKAVALIPADAKGDPLKTYALPVLTIGPSTGGPATTISSRPSPFTSGRRLRNQPRCAGLPGAPRVWSRVPVAPS